MKLKVIGSGSAGNCYILESCNKVLVLEAGMPFKMVKEALNFNIKKIIGVLVTHAHLDHSKYIKDYIDAGINVYSSQKTFDKLNLSSPYLIGIKALERFKIGEFTILPFDTQHDCVEPFGFLINHNECGNVLFATDTYYLKYKFKDLNNILIECNYNIDTLSKDLHPAQRNRLLQSHMSLDTCKKTLQANDLTGVAKIILIHLSDRNGDSKRFKEEVYNQTLCETYIAYKGLKIEFNKDLY